MKTVPLHGAKARGRVALVDTSDLEMVSVYRWRVWERERHDRPSLEGPYAQADAYRDGRRVTIRMHNLIMAVPYIDHRNRNGLDNRRENLRTYKGGQNNANSPPLAASPHGFKGITRDRRNLRRPWRAHIHIDGRHHTLGYFATPEEAALAHDVAAVKTWGEFAYLNFPSPTPGSGSTPPSH